MLHGNKPPYGYRLEDGVLIIYEPEAKIVRLIFTWYVYGDEGGTKLGIRTITRRLTEMKIPTPVDRDGNGFKKRGFGQWASSSVAHILSNETYAGVWHYGKRDSNSKRKPRESWLSIDVPAIVSRELWERAQKQKRHNRELASRNTKHEYLVGRRVTCGECGSRVHGGSARGGAVRYYSCAAKVGRIVGQTCNMPAFRADQVDAAVWEKVKEWLQDPDVLKESLEKVKEKLARKNQPLFDRLSVVDNLLADNRQKLERLLDLYLSGDFGKEMLTERKTRLETTITSLEKERADLVITLESQTLSDEQIKTIVDFAKKVSKGLRIADKDFKARRRIIDMLDVQVRLVIEDSQKVAWVSWLVGEEGVSIVSTSS
jgi:site-specific DNA recombinase